MCYICYIRYKKGKNMAKLEKFLLGTMLVGGLTFGASSCSSKNKDSKEDETEIKAKNQKDATYGDFKKRMQQLTPQLMVETILAEGAEFDDKGLCKPHSKKLNNGKQDKWTHGFGITQLDGKPVTGKTRHITVKEAYEKSVDFYENVETYYFMWCYEIGIDGLCIDTKEKALGLADVMYNAYTSCIEDKNSTTHCNRNQKLRDLYEMYGDTVNAEQVKAIFAEYPIKGNYSFYNALNGGTAEDWANTLGNFCAEQGGIYWRRWLQGQIAMGNITYKDLLDLPIKSMYEFWCLVGKDKSVFFKTNEDGSATVNPEGLKKFKEWIKNPVTKEGKPNTNKTVRQIINSVNPEIIKSIEKATFDAPVQDTYFVLFEQIRQQYSCNAQNDTSYTAYKNGDYDKALKAGKSALQLAETNKQKGAANYNIGISYMELGKYNKAVHYLEQSLAHNETPAGKTALETAKQKQSERSDKRGKTAKGILIGAGIAGAAIYGRKKYLAYNQRQR